jgi:hypothetical protein
MPLGAKPLPEVALAIVVDDRTEKASTCRSSLFNVGPLKVKNGASI